MSALNPELHQASVEAVTRGDYLGALIFGLLAFLLASVQAGFALVKWILAQKKPASHSGKMPAISAPQKIDFESELSTFKKRLTDVETVAQALKRRVANLEGDETETLREMQRTLAEFISKAEEKQNDTAKKP